jgi:hypothetical protein
MSLRKGRPPALGKIVRKGTYAPDNETADTVMRGAVTLEKTEVTRAFVAIGTNAWKAKARLSRIDASTSSDVDRLGRHLDAIVESLQSLGIEIKDHTGEAFDYGQSLKVAASQPKEGISREVVSETIRPTIYLKGHLLQQGEVVIDIPVSKGEV